jgi:predicted small lipoprotein YifL
MSRRPIETAAPSGQTLARRRLLALLALGAVGTLAACGKKGPLRLPEPAPSPPSPDSSAEDSE